MANNRLYIHDKKSGERHLLAKSFGCGWVLTDPDSLSNFLSDPGTDEHGAWQNLAKPTDLELVTEAEVESGQPRNEDVK